jgi:segregation and condensation protein B
MRMRLVRDDDGPMPPLDEHEELEMVPGDNADVDDERPRGRRRKSAPGGGAAPAEPVDGAVEEVEDGADDDESTAIDLPPVDLAKLEALLFSTHHPLTAGRLAEMLGLDTTKAIRRAIKQLNEQYEQTVRSFRIEQVAGGYQLLTLPEHGVLLKKLHQREIDAKLTKAALETLSIIAYKQPILRADVESIRGVACGETIRSLMEKHLVKIAGRAEVPGRPILYGTTKRFLELFGLNSLKDLPQPEDPIAQK